MNNPAVTIGIPFYNAERFLLDSIKSILLQTFRDWELILVDDGSTDNSLKIAKSILDDRIRIISDNKNKKLPARLNEIIDLSRGRYIARMDADDLCSIHRISKQIQFLENHPDIDLVGTGIVYLSDNDEILGVKLLPCEHEEICKQPYRTFGLCHASIMARKEWCLANKYNEKSIQAEDFNLWLNSFERSRFANLSEPLYYYRCEISSTFRKRLRCRWTSMNFLFEYYKSKKRYVVAVYYSLLQVAKFVVGNAMCLFFSRSYYISSRYNEVPMEIKIRCEEELEQIERFSVSLKGQNEHNQPA